MISSGISWFSKQREPLFIITSLVMVLASNIVWYHHYVFFLLPLLVWMGWRRLKRSVLAWCFGGLLLIQVDRTHLTYGLLIHLWGHVSVLALLFWQTSQFVKQLKSGPVLAP